MEQNVDWLVTLQSFGWESAGRIALAALLGAIVGLERLWTGHPAGLRTNMVISVSSRLERRARRQWSEPQDTGEEGGDRGSDFLD